MGWENLNPYMDCGFSGGRTALCFCVVIYYVYVRKCFKKSCFGLDTFSVLGLFFLGVLVIFFYLLS